MPWYVFSSPSDRTIMKLGISVTWIGTIIAARYR